jgi:hypothetical protein
MIKLLKPLDFYPDFNIENSCIFKDHSLKQILKIKPELNVLLSEIIPLIKEKTYLTIDYSELLLSPFSRTCKDTKWHVDGINNNYLIVCWGDFKTTFVDTFYYNHIINFNNEVTDDVRSSNFLLNQDFLTSQKQITPENGQPIIYDSLAIHKGHTATHSGKRIFIRLCMSDYIKPTNRRLL